MGSNAIDPRYYADFRALDGLKQPAKADDPKAIRQVARQFESLFTNMLLKTMRETKFGDGMGDSQQTQFYQEMSDQQLSVEMSRGKGIGLADMLVRQLTQRGQAAAAVPGVAPASVPAVAPAPAAAPVSRAERMSFIESIKPYAQQAAGKLGVCADTLIAHAALETGWGRHLPAAANGASSCNLYGIKAGGGWQGEAVHAVTTEYTAGAAQRVPQAFRSYASLEQGMQDYVSLLQGNPRYQQALGTGSDVGAFASALARGGYATDPDYARKLCATAADVRALGVSA